MFTVYQLNRVGTPPLVHHLNGAASTVFHVGDALKFSNGALVKVGATDKPEYICAGEVSTGASGGKVPVFAVENGAIYESTLSAASAAIKCGAKYTIAPATMQVTATTTDGVAEVVGFEGTAAGDRVYVKF